MRRLATILALASTLWAAGVALAAFGQTAGIALTTHRAGHSTGIAASIHSTDPTAPGAKPKAAIRLVITFPAGTRFNLGTALVKPCRLTDKQLTTPFGRACPRDSQIGTGAAIANASPLQQAVNTRLKVYVGERRQIVLVVQPLLPGLTPIVIRATVSGPRLTLPIPRLALGRAHGFAGVTAVFVSLTLHVPALGTGRNALIVAGRCTAHRFVVRSRFLYADRTHLELSGESRCT